MSTNRKRRVKALEPHSEIVASKDGDRVEKPKKISLQKQFKKATGNFEKDEHSSPSSKAEALSSRLEAKTKNFVDGNARLPVLDVKTSEALHHSAKIKLQLFPINESTRLGLEMDGLHPYLELTLSARKKISSVLKHLDSKWGSSSIAVGEPVLFPYNIAENLADYRWTRNDSCISARDVHLTVGSPAVFRLRYGWMSDPETESVGQYSALDPFDVQKDTHMQKTYGNCGKAELRGEDPGKLVITSEEADAVVADKTTPNEALDSMDNEMRVDSGNGLLSVWADSLTNISIGGLLSEASLMGKLSNCDPKSNGSKEGLQSSQLIADSFDAFLAGQFNPPPNPGPPPQASHSSILDAEDTCHAFSFQKVSSLPEDAFASSGNVYSHSSSQHASSKTFKHPKPIEANVESQGQGCQQSDADMLLCSRVINDESSLGLSGIKWTDSLGPFDLGLSSSHKNISGDGVSFSGFGSK